MKVAADDRRARRGARAGRRSRASGSCRPWARSTPGHAALLRAPRARSATSSSPASSSTRPSSTPSDDLARYPRDETRGRRTSPRRPASTSSSRPRPRSSTRRASRPGSRSTGLGRPARGRVPARALPRRRHRLPQALQHRPPATAPSSGEKDAQQAAVVKQLVARPRPAVEIRVAARPFATRTGSRCRRATPARRRAPAGGARASPRPRRRREPRTRAARTPPRRRSASSTRSRSSSRSTSRSPGFDGRVYLLAAARVGGVRLIDNVLLEGDTT